MAWNDTYSQLGGGYEVGNPDAIRRKYGAQPTPQAPTAGGFPGLFGMGAAGSTGMPEQIGDPGLFGLNTGATPPRAPSENAMQRQQSEAEQGGMRQISPQRRFFWGTGRIDARPTQNPNNTAQRFLPATDWGATFGPNRSHMGSPGTTWAQRQFANRQGEEQAREQRGLSPY